MCIRDRSGRGQSFFLTPKRDHVRRRVIGRPFDDPKGRWRVGGGINVPVKIKWKQLEARSGELMDELLKVDIRARIK